jgi:putative hydrolase
MLKIDLHLHTIASGHAYSTINEYIVQAKKNHMKIIGFTEHGPGLRKEISEVYFRCLDRIPRLVNGVTVFRGVEADIDNEGNLDITDATIGKLDYVIAGLHIGTAFKDMGIKQNTKTVIKAFKSGKINIISHPFVTSYYQTDILAVAEAACENNVLLEVNVNYLREKQLEKHPENLTGLEKMIKIVKKHKQKVIVGSDAHNIWELGDDTPLKKIKKQVGLSEDMIINNYPKELMKLLKIK